MWRSIVQLAANSCSLTARRYFDSSNGYDEADAEDAHVIVWAQGNQSRASEAPASMTASNPPVEYV